MQTRHRSFTQAPDLEAQPFAVAAPSAAPSPSPTKTTHPATPTAKSRPPSKKASAAASYDLNVLSVVLGDRIIRPLYPSLYRFEILGPEPVERLFVCERCYRYTLDVGKCLGHARFCEYADTVPGRVIYAKGRYSIYELDGEEFRLFAQNLSLFSKLFIETKSVCFDVTNFLYYLLVDAYPRSHDAIISNGTEPQKPQIVGFFSKEKLSWDNNNLACILVFPPWQKRGLGQLLVGVSYELSRKEGRIGGPERPLSAPGAHSYNLYWSQAVSRFLLARSANRRVSINDISEVTYILPEDVIGALMHMNVLVMSGPQQNGSLAADDIDMEPMKASTESGSQSEKAATGHVQAKPAAALLGKKLSKKAEGCVLVDRAAVKRWLAQSVGGGVVGTELHVDRAAFVEGAGWAGAGLSEGAGEEEEEEETAGEEGEEEEEEEMEE